MVGLGFYSLRSLVSRACLRAHGRLQQPQTTFSSDLHFLLANLPSEMLWSANKNMFVVSRTGAYGNSLGFAWYPLKLCLAFPLLIFLDFVFNSLGSLASRADCARTAAFGGPRRF